VKVSKPLLCFFFLLILSLHAKGQAENSPLRDFNLHYDRSLQLSKLALHAESIIEMNKAIEIAKSSNLEKEGIQANIDLAEILRKTQDFESGLSILQNIKNSEKYPLQHVRHLDRSIAMYFEGMFYDEERRSQIIQILLDSAIKLAERNGFSYEEALLKNQRGYYMDKGAFAQEALANHLEAANIFLSLSDSLNYINATTKALVIYGNNLKNTVKSDSIIPILLDYLEGKEWYAGETELFGFISDYYLKFNSDSVAYYRWRAKKRESALNYKTQISNSEMDNFRVQQETLRFQQEANTSALALQLEESRTRTLFIILTVLALTIISVAILFSRERKLKGEMRKINDQLKVANNKYQVLMVESNHRIKNNLQMVISMLEFARKDVDQENTKTIRRISNKIYTISALHKHLYVDVHNEQVSIKTYFLEIIKLYEEMSTAPLNVENKIDPVEIKSECIVYFGLIFNEMLSNTIEHNKSKLKKARIRVVKSGNDYHFDYCDNSPWGEEFKEGTGSLLIKQLVQRVGGLDFVFNPSQGQFKFTFHGEG
jgi:two-component sensor histidine kinase